MHPIRDYFLIGDLHTAALVSSKGSIDWLCLPNFDSNSVFAAVLDEKKGGTFAVNIEGYETKARYLPNTAIVELSLKNKSGVATVRDFMVPRPTEDAVSHLLVRRLTCIEGEVVLTFTVDPRPRYARRSVLFKKKDDKLYIGRVGERSVWVHIPADAQVRRYDEGTLLEITVDLKAGQTKDLILEYSFESRIHLQSNKDWEKETAQFWTEWIAKGEFFDLCRDQLIRSAITLKLMQFYPTGGLVAAPTASLPETIGGERNWDYRFVWLRDATFTLYAFYVLGFKEEAKKFFHYIEEVCQELSVCDDESCDADVAVMYTIWGQRLDGEQELPYLSGYERSQPVRIGNGAFDQHQLDIYGSVIDAYYFMSKVDVPISKRGRSVILLMVRKIAAQWKQEESGIWEVRGFTEHFTYGKVMAWVGIDRAIYLADQLHVSTTEKKEWQRLKKEIEDWIWKHCFDAKRGTFVQYKGATNQDATNFLFVLLHFLDRHDPKTKQLIYETCKELRYGNHYVYRYLAKDGLTGEEGAFTLCTFWLIAALAAVDELEEAEKLFESFQKNIAPSGLMAEEIDPRTGRYLGNHPQAFSHIGYIMSAYYIHKYREKQKGRDIDVSSKKKQVELRKQTQQSAMSVSEHMKGKKK